MKRNYESMLIVVPDAGEQVQTEIFAKITKKIEGLGGKVLSSTVWAKDRNFCFFLKSRGAEKKKYYKGCYWLLIFSLDIEKLSDLRETIRLEENILRYLMLRKDETIIDKVVA